MELLPASMVGKANHEMVIAWSSISRNLDVVVCVVMALAGGDGKVLIIYPGLAFAVFMFVLMFIIVVTLAHFVEQ